MRIPKTSLFLISLLLAFISLSGCSKPDPEIRKAVELQIKVYPESMLQDIYKSFFQDEYGPGHLIEDASFAREYFDLELEDMVSRGRHDAEPCGTGKNFVRVPMDLVKDGLIKDEDFFKAFIESSVDFKEHDKLAWGEKWAKVEQSIASMELNIPNYEQDKKAINKVIGMGQPAVHHSDRYSKAYDPHYRIMGKKQWEKLKASLQLAVDSQ
jgi:hypothetical protein